MAKFFRCLARMDPDPCDITLSYIHIHNYSQKQTPRHTGTVRLEIPKRRRTWMSRQSSGSIRDREYGYIYHGTRSREVHTSSEALVRQSHAPQICSSRSWLWPTPCAFRTSSAHRRPLTTPSSRPCPDVPLWTRTTDRRPYSAPRVCVRTRLRSSSAIPPLFRRNLPAGSECSPPALQLDTCCLLYATVEVLVRCVG